MFKFVLGSLGLLLAATAAPAAEHKVTQKNMEFSNKEISIKVGDTIHFVNTDNVTHNVFSASDTFQFDAQMQEPGQTTAVRFTKAGVFEIRCAMHPKMKLKVTATP
jgi:plastocyanin